VVIQIHLGAKKALAISSMSMDQFDSWFDRLEPGANKVSFHIHNDHREGTTGMEVNEIVTDLEPQYREMN